MKYLTRLLHFFQPETAHHVAIVALENGLYLPQWTKDDSRLKVKLWDLEFPNPVGAAAGFDKNARIIRPTLRLGFGFTEVGTVTPLPQQGNPKPRAFRLTEDRAVINRMGFNNDGLEVFTQRVKKYRERPVPGIVGISITNNKGVENSVTDYIACFQKAAPLADYIAIDVSCPNTPDGRDLQHRDRLLDLLEKLQQEKQKLSSQRKPPMLVKLSSDLSDDQLTDILQVTLEMRIDGLIISNTSRNRPATLRSPHAKEIGGLSGPPLKEVSTQCIRKAYKITQGKLPIIGVGGITSGADAYEKIRAGASVIQLYTALIYEGPGLVQKIKRDLVKFLERDGFASIQEAAGTMK